VDVDAAPHLRAIATRFRANPSLSHMLATTAMLRAAKVATDRTEAALAPVGLTMPRYEIVGLLDNAEGGQMTLRDLKRATLLNSSTMTYTIDWLCDHGLIVRAESTTDRRTVIASLTDLGRQTARRAMCALADAHFGLADLSGDDALTVAAVLARVQP
jgi:DNA-binding MarR family transcriptional regulator